MPIHIKFFASLRKAAGMDGLEMEALTVGEAVKKLKKQFTNNDAFLRQIKISNAILNGNNVTWLKGAGTRLSDGDELLFFPPLGGG